MSYDFMLEMKLKLEAPDYHRIFSDNVLCSQNMLMKYKSVFPNYTDHTSLHSLEVIAFCNELVGEQIELLNCDEIFVLLMAAYLHDSGMGISLRDYEVFTPEIPGAEAFRKANPDMPVAEIIRAFHNEYSGRYIQKYAPLFDFPSEEHLFGVIQVSRGHRKTDLYDETEYPREYRLKNGNVLRLPYLAALIRLADELDIAADRNIQFLYDFENLATDASRLEFKKHMAIKQLKFAEDAFEIQIDGSVGVPEDVMGELIEKLESTLALCVDVTAKRTPFKIKQTKIVTERI